MTFGMYFYRLIESGQVERFDKDMQKVYDIGVAEIERQGGKDEQGQAEDRTREGRRREDAARSRKRALPGTLKWRVPLGGIVGYNSPAIAEDGTVYIGSSDKNLYAIDPKDGSEKWRFAMNGVDDMDSSPAMGGDGTIYVASRDGNLYAINGESGGLAKAPWPMFGLDVTPAGLDRAAIRRRSRS